MAIGLVAPSAASTQVVPNGGKRGSAGAEGETVPTLSIAQWVNEGSIET